MSSVLPFTILRYLGRAVGKAEAERVRAAAGETRTMAELMARGSWSSVASTVAIGDAAARLTGDPQIGRRGGEELFRFLDEIGLTDASRAAGSIEAAIEVVAATSSKASVGRVVEVVGRERRRLLIEGRYTEGTPPRALFCDYSLGYWSSIPSLFGAVGYAVEHECQARGDERCLISVSWVDAPAPVNDAESAQARSDRVITRYEELQGLAAQLTEAEDVAAALDVVVARAGHAVLAPRFLVAVRVGAGERLRVHHLGFADAAAAERAAKAIVEGRPSPSTMVVDVASARRHHGCLAAFYPKGTQGTEVDRRLLSAYASHVAAALDAKAAFEQARRDRDTARALLDLSRRLARASTVQGVSQQLADAVPALSGGHGSIYLWDPAALRLVFGACDPSTEAASLPSELVIEDIEGAAELLSTGAPVFLDVEYVTGDLLHLLESTGMAQAACLPVVARGDFLGLVTAGFEQRIGDDDKEVLIERLAAFADQAATALDNARLLERTRHQATHDELTGLPNRPMLEERATRALAGERRGPGRPAFLFIDLDRFKNVNDTLGHHAGDDLIRQVAVRVARELREGDTLARLGGDEFVALLVDVEGERGAVLVAERIIRCFESPFAVAGAEVFVSCSIGVAIAPGKGAHYGVLLQNADAAMYEAKAAGANSYVVHDGRRDGRRDDRRHHRLELESSLHGALARGELSVEYQPQVDMRTGRIVGAEALVRWDHPVLGRIGPDVFVPIAEESGLILDIDRWVRLTALAEVRRWRQAGLPALRISFNLSTRELHNPYLPLQLAGDLAAAGVDAGLVELEITERVVMVDDDDLVRVLRSLRAVGVRLAIDDFGTGSSVLRRLQRHPVDTLKIDRSFIADITDPSPAAVVAALVQMGASLGIDVLAEGVETEEQRSVLVGLGCPLAQGYLFSRPVPAGEMLRLLKAAAEVGVGELAPALVLGAGVACSARHATMAPPLRDGATIGAVE